MRRTFLICLLGGGAVWSGCADGAGGPGGAAGVVTTDGLSRLDFRQVIKEAQGRVFPSVVFVKCLREGHESGKKITSEMIGSGVLISPDGELLTNWHVVDKAAEIRCLLYDGRALDAEVLGKDKDTDLALVKLKLPADGPPTPYAPLGDSTRLKEGDFVMAMGAPWGLNRSVSIGIVSCMRRYLPDHSEYGLWLQTDAAISPGNSGGPLVNTGGEVVGINTRSVLFGGDMGFAVPAEIVRIIVPQLRTHGRVDWSWTGLRLQPLKDFKRNIYFEGDQGVVVASTDPESPARRAGVRPRDRILAIGDKPLTAVWEEDLPGVRRQIGLLEKDRPVAVRLIRDGKEMTLTFTPRAKGKVEGEELDCPRWDMTVKAINQFDNPDLYFHRKRGVFVYGVKYPGNAREAGLNEKDILLKIDGKRVETLADLKKTHAELIENVDTRHRVLVSVLRNGLLRQVVLDFSRDYEKE